MSQPEPQKRRVSKTAEQVGHKAERKIAARSRPERSVWFGLGMFEIGRAHV